MQNKMAAEIPAQTGAIPFLRLNSINYNIDNIRVLNSINLDIRSSEIQAIVGEHGSGKSSLGMIISGTKKPASGEIIYNDQSFNFLSIQKSKKMRIEMVYQSIYLIDFFTIAENLLMPDNMAAARFLNKKKWNQKARSILEQYGYYYDPTLLVKNLPITEQMIIYIIRSLCREPDLLILDSVFEKLSAAESEKISKILIQLKNKGVSVLCLTNRIDDIYDLADRVTILRNGEILLSDSINNIDRINLIKLCYSQFSKTENSIHMNQEFSQLLKYNEAILLKLPINLIVTDDQNRIRMVNEYGCTYFKLDNREYNNLLLDDLFSPENIEALKLIKKSFSEKKENAFYDVPLNLKTGKATINIKTLPIYDGAFLIGNIIIIEDVSNQENLRQQVILSEKLASVGLLAAGVAHEINNPLEIIYNYLKFLKLNLKQKPIVNTINDLEEEITYIKQIVSNLISFSDANKISNEEFDLNELLKSVVNLIKYSVINKKIKISFSSDQTVILFQANKNELKQVILNLLKNSIEAMPDGGQISIASRITGNSEIHISIIDTGCGIQDENPNNIFLPFYSTKKRGSSNLGLGLSVSYGIIKKYRGNIRVENLTESGCQFIITLPKN